MDQGPVKLLTDTHTLVWALTNAEALGPKARRALEKFSLTASVANLWELILKADRPGALVASPVPWWDKHVAGNGILCLSIKTNHLRALSQLRDVHKDPFDRILVAQAKSENLILVSKDKLLSEYGVELIW